MKKFTPDERNRLQVFIRSFIDIHATISSMDRPVSWMIVRMAIRYGEIAKIPMNVSALANFTQISRPTIHRHLLEMEKENLVELPKQGRTVIPKLLPIDPETQRFYRQLLRIADRANRQMSDLDTTQQKAA